jgi:hypothetical protein
MNGLEGVPEWFSGAVVGAVLAALGYIAKLAIEQWRLIHAARASRLACLAELSSLLRAGWASFAIQNEHAQQFVRALNRERCADIAEDGYEQSMVDAFPNFGPAERELHAIIRGITIHSLRPINQDLLVWVKRDSTFKDLSSRPGLAGELAKKLGDLEAHLFLWHAKYETWIPDHPEHALVYLADEKAHGLGFPVGLDKIVERALGDRSWFWG